MLALPQLFFRVAIFAMLAWLVSSCAVFKKADGSGPLEREPTAASRMRPQKVGMITLVNEVEKFVLIDTGVSGVPAIGTALKSFTGEISSGVVTVGNVNRRPFVVADIVQGAPLKGDEVFQ